MSRKCFIAIFQDAIMVTEPFTLATPVIKLLETRREFAKTLAFGQGASLTARRKVSLLD